MILHIKKLPMWHQRSRSKRFYFNLNAYRNAHYQVLNKSKKYFAAWVRDLGINETFEKPICIKYDIWCPSNSDFMNYGAVMDKFLQDAVVKCGIIKDDNIKYVKQAEFYYKGKGRRTDAYIKEID